MAAELGLPVGRRYFPKKLPDKMSIPSLEEGIIRKYTRYELVQKIGVSSDFLTLLIRKEFLCTEDLFLGDEFSIDSNSLERTRLMLVNSREMLRSCERKEEETIEAAVAIASVFQKNKWLIFEKVVELAAKREREGILPLEKVAAATVEFFGTQAEEVFSQLIGMKVPAKSDKGDFILRLCNIVGERAAAIRKNLEVAKNLPESVRKNVQPNAVDFCEDARGQICRKNGY